MSLEMTKLMIEITERKDMNPQILENYVNTVAVMMFKGQSDMQKAMAGG